MAAVGKRINALLNGYGVPAIREMAATRGVTVVTGSKKATLVALAEHAADPDSVARMLAGLSAEQRALLDLLLLYPGEVSTGYITAAATAARLVQPDDPKSRQLYYYSYVHPPVPGNPAAAHSKRLADLVAGLSARVLALASGEGSYTPALELGLAAHIAVPAEVRATLLGLLNEPPPQVAAPAGPVAGGEPRYAHRGLFLLWSAVRAKPAQLTQMALVRKVDARRLGQALGVAEKTTEFDTETDLPYLYFVRVAAHNLHLLIERDGRLDAAGRERLREFLAQPWPVRTLRMLAAWLDTAAHDLAMITDTSGGWQTNRYLPPPTTRHGYERLFRLIAALPGDWIALEGFVRWLRRYHFGFLALPDDEPLPIYDLGTQLYRLSYGALPGEDPWESCEGDVVRKALQGPLHWLGLVDLAGAPGPEQAFRLTPAGRTLLAAFADPAREAEILAPLVASPATGRVVVQPNFQILAMGDVPDETLFALSEVAELVRAEQVVEFKLTRGAVYAAQQAGWTASAILDLLRGASGAPLAQNVERSILDWAAAHERIVFRRNATLLAAREPALLDRLAADPQTAPLLAERLLPTLALVRPPAGGAVSLAGLDRRLLAAGELPATSDVIHDAPVPAFAFDAAGRVTWKGPLPDLRVLGLLAGLTRPGPDGSLVLDEKTVRATAAARRWKPADVPPLLDALTAWHEGPLPAAVERRIKVWAGYQGRAQLRAVTILTVDRPELLDELRADPAVAPLLAPLAADGTLALVVPPPAPRSRGRRAATEPAAEAPAPADTLDTLRQALLERGFTLDGDE
jgi:hypothetical protein